MYDRWIMKTLFFLCLSATWRLFKLKLLSLILTPPRSLSVSLRSFRENQKNCRTIRQISSKRATVQEKRKLFRAEPFIIISYREIYWGSSVWSSDYESWHETMKNTSYFTFVSHLMSEREERRARSAAVFLWCQHLATGGQNTWTHTHTHYV